MIYPHAIYQKPTPKDKKVTAKTRVCHWKWNLTLRSKFKVNDDYSWYLKHCLCRFLWSFRTQYMDEIFNRDQKRQELIYGLMELHYGSYHVLMQSLGVLRFAKCVLQKVSVNSPWWSGSPRETPILWLHWFTYSTWYTTYINSLQHISDPVYIICVVEQRRWFLQDFARFIKDPTKHSVLQNNAWSSTDSLYHRPKYYLGSSNITRKTEETTLISNYGKAERNVNLIYNSSRLTDIPKFS